MRNNHSVVKHTMSDADRQTDSEASSPQIESFGHIVAAFASREAATVDEIMQLAERLSPLLLGTERQFAAGSGAVSNEINAQQTSPVPPALPIENAVKQDKVFCLCCGRGFTMLKRHLKAEHGLTEDQYRARFGLSDDFPLVAPSYSERKAMYAKRIGLGKYEREKSEYGQPSNP